MKARFKSTRKRSCEFSALKNMFTEMASMDMESQDMRENMLLQRNSAYELHLLHEALDLHEPTDIETERGAEDVDGYVPVDSPVGLGRKRTRKKTNKFQGLKSSNSLEDLSKSHESLLEDYVPVEVPEYTHKRRTSTFSEGDIMQPPVLQLVHKFESSTVLRIAETATL